MINDIIERLQLVPGATVREGFYAQSLVRESKFIFLQPHTSKASVPGMQLGYKEDITLQIVAGIKIPGFTQPTSELINLTREIRSCLFSNQRDPARPNWLNGAFGLAESEECKFIMPEAHEHHGLAVITISISNSPTFEDRL
ncbi:hypothetical protein [Shewanella algae]|uniref:hypothetical protein n=1 Tax=Shewanella algae TaxID=38313 RepID=UPI001AAEDB43|nr:hypothetical protein [Shewanella algae]MBO2589538.1 hypothetical protein [Shewanella algae]